MGVASFEKGAVILIKEYSHVLKRIFDDSWQVEEEKTGRIKEFKLNQLHRLYQKGELIFANDMKFDPLSADHQKDMKRASAISLITSKDEWDEAKVKRQYILAIMDFPATQKAIEPEIHKVWAQLGANGRAPHWGTVLRWKKKYIHAGKDIYGVVKRIRDRGNRKRRYPREVLAIIEEAVDKVYMTRERKTYEDTLNNAIVRIERENKLRPEEMQLPLPTLRLIKSAVSSISAFDRHAARYGRMAATKMFRAVLKQLVSKSVLERAEIDHTKLGNV